MQGAREQFLAAGADVVLIGQATPADAAGFRRQFELELTVLVDEKRASYKAIGAKVAGVAGLFGPRVVLRAFMTVLGRRVRQGKTIGHPAQLGAALVIAPGDEVLFEQHARDASDNVAPADLLAAIEHLPTPA
ncbi:MAG: AhpC/TSA family protein [Solirubrobacteraceae bacterium]